MIFTVLGSVLILPFVASQAFSNHKSCGVLLRNLAHSCGQSDRSPFEECCTSIRDFNDNYCFCNPSSFAPAVQLSGDPYGFSARMHTCNVSKPYSRPVAYRDLPKGPDTCPYLPGVSPAAPDAHGEVGSDSAQCQDPEELRKSREEALDVFDGLFLPGSSQTDVDTVRGLLQDLLDKDANLTSIGLTEAYGRSEVEEFFLARLVGKFEWRGKERNDVMWSAPWHVSYALHHGDHRMRFTFVSFQHCSNKIADVHIVEDGVMSALGSQFYYPDLKKDAFTEYDVTPSQFCENITTSCAELSPYSSEEECLDLHILLKAEKRVLCNDFENDRLSMNALLGDTIACRYHYLLMSRTNPVKFCPLVGVDGKGFCARSKCPDSYYGDMFGDAGRPRYESSDGFSCSLETGICHEQWSVGSATSPET